MNELPFDLEGILDIIVAQMAEKTAVDREELSCTVSGLLQMLPFLLTSRSFFIAFSRPSGPEDPLLPPEAKQALHQAMTMLRAMGQADKGEMLTFGKYEHGSDEELAVVLGGMAAQDEGTLRILKEAVTTADAMKKQQGGNSFSPN